MTLNMSTDDILLSILIGMLTCVFNSIVKTIDYIFWTLLLSVISMGSVLILTKPSDASFDTFLSRVDKYGSQRGYLNGLAMKIVRDIGGLGLRLDQKYIVDYVAIKVAYSIEGGPGPGRKSLAYIGAFNYWYLAEETRIAN